MAKARLRRGIEIIKLANRIESLKMQEDESEGPTDSDVPSDSTAAAGAALASVHAGDKAGEETGTEKKTLKSLAKGAIFREVVLAKVREMKEAETALQVEKDAHEKEAKRKSFSGAM
jgi:calcium/calmodulin-dependent protein kinase I